MNDAIAKIKDQFQDFVYKSKVQLAKLFKRPMPKDPKAASTESGTTYEINLVPAVKYQLIKAQKVRNRVLFSCIVISCTALGVILVLFSIKSGQDIAMSSQDRRLEKLSEKLNSYSELDSLLTIQNQLDRYNKIIENRRAIPRIFGAVGVMLPQIGGTVQLSELRVDVDTNIVTMEGQADANTEPLIDYRVLEAFKKAVGLTKYDYGRYVDADGNEIPTQCIKESNGEGSALREGDSYYAWWDLTIPGCEATRVGDSDNNDSSDSNNEIPFRFSKDAEVEIGTIQVEEEVKVESTESEDNNGNIDGIVSFEESLENDLQSGTNEVAVEKVLVDKEVPVRVKIWRTPRFNSWYKSENMSLDGSISNIEHFQSACYKYNGTEVISNGRESVRWASTNDCLLAEDGLEITGSSNGRNSDDNLVLRFSATATLADNFFSFRNKHMIAIGPMAQNVTDSFLQVGSMFTQEARACDPDDLECLGDTTNSGGDSSDKNSTGDSTGSSSDKTDDDATDSEETNTGEEE